jgi:hypothetical protein
MKTTETFGQTHELGTKAARPCTLVVLAACLASSQQQHSAPAGMSLYLQRSALHACLRCMHVLVQLFSRRIQPKVRQQLCYDRHVKVPCFL